ncbi:abortive infection family protein [Exiguobacterium sp. s55]|uniref:abortive infection family protein n=1 Tax=Exiguobacterium sp. s55 TaxID=2751245 RepID=UPI001BEAFAED|nr:abortive infection family protein [Exiguobacterium sp. s55]
MANLSAREKAKFEELFEMSGGYVLDFTNATFQSFIADIVNIDVYSDRKYERDLSKANRLRQIWNQESDLTVGKLMEEFLGYYEDYQTRLGISMTDRQTKLITELRDVVQRLLETNSDIDFPESEEENLNILLEDIRQSLLRQQPVLVLDRLHTFSTKMLRQICLNHGISFQNEKGNNLPLHSLAGMLKKKYETEQLFESSFTIKAIQTSISLFDEYNNVRNNQSFAHDNDILNSVEADFIVRTMANVLTFIDKVEAIGSDSVSKNQFETNDDVELLF